MALVSSQFLIGKGKHMTANEKPTKVTPVVSQFLIGKVEHIL